MALTGVDAVFIVFGVMSHVFLRVALATDAGTVGAYPKGAIAWTPFSFPMLPI